MAYLSIGYDDEMNYALIEKKRSVTSKNLNMSTSIMQLWCVVRRGRASFSIS